MVMVIVAGVTGAVVAAAVVYAVMAAKVGALKVEAARQESERDAQRQLLEAQRRHYEAVIAQGEAQFKTLAQKILEERSAALKKEGAESIGNLLAPLQRQIAEFKARVDAVNSEDVKRTAELTKGIEDLVRQTNTVSEQANNLATAIRSDAQVTGAWGESQLKRVLELGGLQETVHYDYQETFASPGSDRKDLRTDVLVKMPDDRWLVIDAKTTMAAYVDYVKAEADESAAQAREVSRERIVASVKNHVDELKNAAYHRNLSATTGKKLLNTMLMYIPFDEVFLIAMKAEVNVAGERVLLREYARRNDVVFVNSSSLMPVIRLIEMLWARDKADRKALKIKESAETLIEKFNGFLTAADGFMAIGKHLGDAAKCYNASLKRLATGPGNVIKKLSDMKEMGVSSAAKLPPPEEVEAHPVAVEIAAKALLLAFLAVGTAFGGEKPPSYFSMRCDDNHSVREWREVAEAFEAVGLRASFAVVSSALSDEQGACLRELSERGHEIMDHTGQHAFYNMRFQTAEECAAVAREPFVAEVESDGKGLRCNAVVDWNHKSAFRFRGAIKNGEVIVTDQAALKRLHFTAKFYVPAVKRWFGVYKLDGDRRFVYDFWRRKLPADFAVAETEMVTLAQDAIQPSTELLRAQAALTRRNFDRFGIRRPTFWIQPGGWESFLGWEGLMAVHGGEFGYHGADAIVGGSQWRGALGDPAPERGRWTFQSDFGYFDEGNDLAKVKHRLADSLARNRSFSYISHMNGRRCGGWEKWLEQTRAFARWLKASGIRATTHTKLVDAVYAQSVPPDANVFPSLTCDLDGDGLADGLKDGHGVTCDLKAGTVTIDKGHSLTVDGLCGLTRGAMEFSFHAEGAPGTTVAVQFHQSGRYGGWFAHDNANFKLDASGKGDFTLPVTVQPATIGATIIVSAPAAVKLSNPRLCGKRDAAIDPVKVVKAELARGTKEIRIPKGRYFISPDGAEETVYFRLSGVCDTTIDFGGAELVGNVRTRMFDLEGCTNVTIRNVAIDFRELPFTQATIEKVDADGNWDVRVIEGYPRPDMRAKGQGLDNHDDFWPIQAYDGKTHELKNPMRYLDGVAIVQTGESTYRITGGKDRRGAVGDIAVWSVKERGRPVVGENVNAVACAGLVFEDVVQYATPHGRAFIDWSSSNTTYLRCRVVRRPPETDLVPRGLRRLRSGNHDAFISKNALVGPKIVDCVAEYHCDDCVNISGAYQVIYEGEGNRVRVFVHGAWGLQIDAGDVCQVLTPGGETPANVRVTAIEEGPAIRPEESAYLETIGLWPGIAKTMRKSYVLTLDRKADFPRGTLLASERHMGNGFVIRGCRFGSTRARGLLVKASHGVIENCDVDKSVCFTTEYEWLSAGVANDITLRNNRFKEKVYFGGRAAHNKPISPAVNRGIVEEKPDDNLWMWGHHPKSLYAQEGTHTFGLPVVTCMDMAEACRSMGIGGCFVVRWHNMPTKAELPKYVEQFKDLPRVGFSITDGAVEDFEEKVRLGFELAERMPNLTTFVMDDYWAASGYRQPIARIRALKTELARRGLKLAVVLYSDTNGLKPEFKEVLDLCDEITYWFWNGKNVGGIEESVDRLRAFVGPTKPILLGQYMWDFGGKRPMPPELMRSQLDQTARLLDARKIAGVIFHCTILAGMDLEAVEISRRWIQSRTGGPWRCVGPGGGGWIEDLLYSRHAPNRLWVGCDVGGVYLSEDGGRHYEMRSDGFRDFFIESLTEHPTNPDILFAASHGIYKTTDRGKTWVEKRQGLPQPQAYSYAISIARIVFDPRDANRLYAAVGNARLGKGDDKHHLYVSTDCGESWREVVAPDQFPAGTRLHDLVVDPRDGDRLVAATSTGVYRSTDGGVHWQAARGLPAHGRVRRVALAPSAPDVIYATLRQKGGEKPWAAGVYRSDDGGRTFSPRNGGLSCRPGVAGAGDMLSDWYDRFVVDPRNSDVAYLGGATWWAPGVFKTTDGGARWTRVTRREKDRPADGWLEPPGHPAVASLALSPLDPERLAYGTDFLVRCSDDGGASWRPAYTARRTDGKSSTIGLETTCVKEIVADPHRRGRFLCAFLDIGAWTTSDNGETFEAKFVNDHHSCFSIAQSPTEPDLVWQLAGSHGRVADASRRVLVSRDGCRSWQPVLKDPPEWMHPKCRDLVCLTDRAPYRLACLTVRGVATSADGGETWSLLSTNALPVAARVSRLKRLGETIYAGTAANDREGGAIWKSLDRGVTWTKVEGLPASAGGVSDIAVDGDRIIVTTGEHYVRAEQRMLKGGAWLSTDAGRTWRQVYKARACRCCAFSRGRLLVGIGYDSFFDHYAVGGVWLSEDAGATWQSLNDRSLVNRNVNAITVDPFDADSIWVATQGNAIFTRRLP